MPTPAKPLFRPEALRPRLAAEARRLERQVGELVNAAYGLTAAEVALLWRTAPPRMPGERPV